MLTFRISVQLDDPCLPGYISFIPQGSKGSYCPPGKSGGNHEPMRSHNWWHDSRILFAILWSPSDINRLSPEDRKIYEEAKVQVRNLQSEKLLIREAKESAVTVPELRRLSDQFDELGN